MENKFKLKSEFKPAGDQVKAIKELTVGLEDGKDKQTLLGVTGSGKTFTVANIIEKFQKPTLIIAHNKTLAAQLAQEYKDFFPENSVNYFVSYYDYYQPEAYMPVTDTYIEKEAQINEEIDRLRHASTQALLTRKDVIIVASVSCIYGLGSPEEYREVNLEIKSGQKTSRRELMEKLVDIHFFRTNADLTPGSFRGTGNFLEIMPVNEKIVYRIEIESDEVKQIFTINHITREIFGKEKSIFIFPAKHFITNKEAINRAIKNIKSDLQKQIKNLQSKGKNLEAERLKRRTNYDLALIRETGYCSGIENYSRYFSGKKVGEAPDTLLSYFPKTKNGKPDFLTIIDESHVTLPQLGGMYAGDASRKETLVEHGFRLPSAKDNRPLKFDEFGKRTGQTIYTSATPGKYEMAKSKKIVEQIIRPTGLIDPILEVRGVVSNKKYKGQIMDFIDEAEKTIKKGGRVIATTLTKKMAENLADFLKERKIKSAYIHSDIKTLERIEILTDFRKGKFDFLVGVNLLREGLDLPEVSLIGILDADKEGFLRSTTSLIQIIGRAARNVEGKVILYADTLTKSLKESISETQRRREIQMEYNKKHGIVPKTITKNIKDITDQIKTKHQKAVDSLLEMDRQMYGNNLKKIIKEKERQMEEAVKTLDFETAAIVRDEIKILLGDKTKKKT